MTREKFITERTRIISEMLDNPDKYGIYPTTKCFEQLDALFDELTATSPSSATAEEPYRCPVCGGNGLVPNGFYCQTSGDWPTTSISPEVCRSCNGTGVIFAAVLLHVIKTNEQ